MQSLWPLQSLQDDLFRALGKQAGYKAAKAVYIALIEI